MAVSHGHALPLIPRPADLVRQQGAWLFGHELTVSIADDSFAETASHLAGELDAAGNCRTAVVGSGADADVRILPATDLPDDGYRLAVDAGGVELAAATPAGAFHGTQTLLQAWFVRRACRYLRERGRTVIGWDEVLEGDGPDGDTVIMAWRGVDRGVEAARRGHRVIMTPNPFTYLNYTPYDPPRPPGHQRHHLPLETAYAFDPVPAELDASAAARIIGSQACLWTEYVETRADVDELTWPRLSALAEAAWSPSEARDWSDFRTRLDGQVPLFEQLGVSRTANW